MDYHIAQSFLGWAADNQIDWATAEKCLGVLMGTSSPGPSPAESSAAFTARLLEVVTYDGARAQDLVDAGVAGTLQSAHNMLHRGLAKGIIKRYGRGLYVPADCPD